MKKALTNALIYYAVAGAFYLLLLVSPEVIQFYGFLFFYLIHFPGVMLRALIFQYEVGQEPHWLRYADGFILVTVNATLVFLLRWIGTYLGGSTNTEPGA